MGTLPETIPSPWQPRRNLSCTLILLSPESMIDSGKVGWYCLLGIITHNPRPGQADSGCHPGKRLRKGRPARNRAVFSRTDDVMVRS
jgi:hypothetical protein